MILKFRENHIAKLERMQKKSGNVDAVDDWNKEIVSV